MVLQKDNKRLAAREELDDEANTATGVDARAAGFRYVL
jgi:hypothetical protein